MYLVVALKLQLLLPLLPGGPVLDNPEDLLQKCLQSGSSSSSKQPSQAGCMLPAIASSLKNMVRPPQWLEIGAY